MTNLAPVKPVRPRGEQASGFSLAASVTLLACIVGFAGLFALTWLPAHFGNDGWLFLFPVFLVAWVPVELGAITAVALAVAGVAQERRAGVRRKRGWLTILAGVAFVCLSLPMLWFGNLPLVFFSGMP